MEGQVNIFSLKHTQEDDKQKTEKEKKKVKFWGNDFEAPQKRLIAQLTMIFL